MKLLIAATAVLAVLSTAALAEDTTTTKGQGGQYIAGLNQQLHELGTNLGQMKQAYGTTGKEQGSFISDLNAESNHPDNP